MPTAMTPGLVESLSNTAWLNVCDEAAVGYVWRGNRKLAETTWSARKPGSTARILWKLRKKAMEAVTSTKATAISPTTRIDRSQVWLAVPEALGPATLRLSIGLARKAPNAGARLQTRPVATDKTSAKAATPASMAMESTRGIDSGSKCKVIRITMAASARPNSPPPTPSSKPSATHSRTTALELAPNARRKEYSRLRRMARTNNRPATFAQAANRTTDTASERMRSIGRTSPTPYSNSGITSPRM